MHRRVPNFCHASALRITVQFVLVHDSIHYYAWAFVVHLPLYILTSVLALRIFFIDHCPICSSSCGTLFTYGVQLEMYAKQNKRPKQKQMIERGSRQQNHDYSVIPTSQAINKGTPTGVFIKIKCKLSLECLSFFF